MAQRSGQVRHPPRYGGVGAAVDQRQHDNHQNEGRDLENLGGDLRKDALGAAGEGLESTKSVQSSVSTKPTAICDWLSEMLTTHSTSATRTLPLCSPTAKPTMAASSMVP